MFERVKKVVSDWLYGPEKTITKTPVVIDKNLHRIDPKLVSFGARRTCELLQARGYKAYIVGGAVRDLLLGVQPKDFDVATDATPEQVKRCQRRAFIIGRRFRLVHVVFRDEIIECSTFRALDAQGVRKDANGRVISDNVFGEMWEDAARRDFTINALYYDPITEKVFDYHGGFKDIQRKELRMIGEPEERYREDPVRMMRAVRIATKLGFSMERETERAIPKMARLLENVPAARLFDEMMKLFTCGHAEACLLKLREEGLHRSLLPMLDVIFEEPGGEKFLLLALKRTDERIAIGKKISPAFLFASLLWPQVKERWGAYQKRPGMYRARALYAAADDVLATQCQKLAIQNRFLADMKLIWMLQLRFERCTGKNPYSLVRHPKYRAGYDFMLLRSLVGEVAPERVRWWELFVEAAPEERESMIAEQEILARRTGDLAREGQRRKLADEDQLLAEVEEIAANGGRKPRPWEEARCSISDDSHVSESAERPDMALNDDEGENRGADELAGRTADEGLSRSARRRRRRRERISVQKAAEQQGEAVVRVTTLEKKVSVADTAEPAVMHEKIPSRKVAFTELETKPLEVVVAKKSAQEETQMSQTVIHSGAAVQLTKVERTIISASGEKLVQIETIAPSVLKPQESARKAEVTNSGAFAVVDKSGETAKEIAVGTVAALQKPDPKLLLTQPIVITALSKPVEKPARAKPEEKLSPGKPQPQMRSTQPPAEKPSAVLEKTVVTSIAVKPVESAEKKQEIGYEESEKEAVEKSPAKTRKTAVRKKTVSKKESIKKMPTKKAGVRDGLSCDMPSKEKVSGNAGKKKMTAKTADIKQTTVRSTVVKKLPALKKATSRESHAESFNGDETQHLVVTKKSRRKLRAAKNEQPGVVDKTASRRSTTGKSHIAN